MNIKDILPEWENKNHIISIVLFILILNCLSLIAFWSTFNINIVGYVSAWQLFGLSTYNILASCSLIILSGLLHVRELVIEKILQNPLQKGKIDIAVHRFFLKLFNSFFRYEEFYFFAGLIFCFQLSSTEYYNKWNYILTISGIVLFGYLVLILILVSANNSKVLIITCVTCLSVALVLIAYTKEKSLKIFYNIEFEYFEPSKDQSHKYFNGETSLKYIGEAGDKIFFSNISNTVNYIVNNRALDSYTLSHYQQAEYTYNKPHRYTNEMDIFTALDKIGIPGWLTTITNKLNN